MVSKLKIRLFGLLFVLVGGGLTYNSWYVAHWYGDLWNPGGVIFPMMFFVGVFGLLFPVDKESLIAKFGVEVPQTLEHYTIWQKGILFGGAGLSILNVIALNAVANEWFVS